MRAGTLDRRVALFAVTTTNTGTGPVEVVTDLGSIWAGRRDVSDGEKAAAGTVQGTLVSRFTIRSTSGTRALKPKDRLSEGGQVFDITGVKDLGRRDYLEITAEARLD